MYMYSMKSLRSGEVENQFRTKENAILQHLLFRYSCYLNGMEKVSRTIV